MHGKSVGRIDAYRTFERVDGACGLVRRQMPRPESGECFDVVGIQKQRDDQ